MSSITSISSRIVVCRICHGRPTWSVADVPAELAQIPPGTSVRGFCRWHNARIRRRRDTVAAENKAITFFHAIEKLIVEFLARLTRVELEPLDHEWNAGGHMRSIRRSVCDATDRLEVRLAISGGESLLRRIRSRGS